MPATKQCFLCGIPQFLETDAEILNYNSHCHLPHPSEFNINAILTFDTS